MKIAVPVLDDKISPRFDSTYKFIIVSVKNGKINVNEDIVLSTINPSQRGEINSYTLSNLDKKGINVIHSVIGNTEEVLNLFLSGKLKQGITIFPDGRKICRKVFLES